MVLAWLDGDAILGIGWKKTATLPQAIWNVPVPNHLGPNADSEKGRISRVCKDRKDS